MAPGGSRHANARLALLLPLWAMGSEPSNEFDWDGCTSIAVGRDATVDGSVMASHSNDCSVCDWRMVYVPARDHAQGAVRTVYDGTWLQYPRIIDPDRATAYQAGAGVNASKTTGTIPQVPHTYALWENAYGLMNEAGLALGESTCSAHLVGQGVLDGGDALFSIRELMAVALERCATARCAIQTMGDVGARYGFFGEDPGQGGAGEAVTVADKTGEVWVFHISGGVPRDAKAKGPDRWAGQRGAMWAAQRVPDNHVAIIANNFIIRRIDFDDAKNFMFHPGLRELTHEAGLWHGEGHFDFLTIMAPDIQFFSYMAGLPPIPMYTALRMWWVFRSVAPSLNIDVTPDCSKYPFSVPVDKKLTAIEVMNLFRSHYEGTEFDMRLGALAGPWQSPNRIEGGAGMKAFPGQFARGTSIFRTAYTQVGQTGPGIEPVVWFGPDASSSSVMVPFFAKALTGPSAGQFDVASFGQGSMKEFSFTSGTPPAWWAFDFVANWMEHSYQNMSETYVYPKRDQLQKEVVDRAMEAVKAAAGQPDDQAAQTLVDVQTDIQRSVTEEWWSFAAMLVVRYNDFFFNWPENDPTSVGSIGYPPFWLEMIGFNRQSFYPSWFSRTPEVPQLLATSEKRLAKLSVGKGEGRSAWASGGVGVGRLDELPPSALGGAVVACLLAAFACVFAAGVALGARLGRQSGEVGGARYVKLHE